MQAQYKRCGKKNCRCASGVLHGPYYYLFFRKNGKLTKRYVLKHELDTVKQLCGGRRVARAMLRLTLARIRLNLKKLKIAFKYQMRRESIPDWLLKDQDLFLWDVFPQRTLGIPGEPHNYRFSLNRL